MSGFINIKLLGNIFYLKAKVDYKLIILGLLPFILQPTLKFMLSGNPFGEHFLQDFLQDIPYYILCSCLVYSLINHKHILYFLKMYLTNHNMIFVILIQSLIALYVFLMLNNFAIYAIFGALFWFSSGVLRGIIQSSNAIFKEDTSKLMELIRIYGLLRISYFFIFVILLMDLFEITPIINIIFNLNHRVVAIPAIPLSLFYSLMSIIVFLPCLINLYPYITKSLDVQRVLELIRFISSSKKGYKFNELSSKFNDLTEDELKQYLDGLIHVEYVEKENRYRLTSRYQKIMHNN